MIADIATLGRFSILGRLDRALLFISLAAGFGYLFGRVFEPYPGSVVVKALGVSPLVFFALRTVKDRDGLILGTSLIFSVGGDVFLGLDRENFFVFGLASFLIAHVFYIVLFVRSWPMRLIVSPVQKILSGLILAFSASMVIWLWSSLDDLLVPVIIYIGVITAMGVCAVLAGFHAPWVVAGAVLFILSDAVIAITKFKIAFAAGPFLIWSMYYLGQYLIVVGYVREKFREEWVVQPSF
jgi:uncharacterized membrane protein YhhN